MQLNQPPFAVAPTAFRFPGLAALAGRAPLGGQREVALAVYLAARLAHDALPARGIPVPVRAERSASAKQWLSTLALPGPVRPTLVRLIEASAGVSAAAAPALRDVMAVTASYLDSASRLELDLLAGTLAGPSVPDQR